MRHRHDGRDGGGPFRADRLKYYRICFRTETPTRRQRLRLFATHFGFQCVAIYRLDRFTRRLAARWRPAVVLVKAASLLSWACELFHHVRIRAEVGPGLYIGHVGTIYIGPTRIGRNFSCTHNVTVGFGHSQGASGYPVIGDDVWVGTGSVLSGPIHVGDGATVANGTMLSRSVPAGALCGGVPGRVLRDAYDNAPLLGTAPAPVA